MTECGPVVGVHNAQLKLDVFKGIPFAAPPVLSLRWQPTRSLKAENMCWNGPFNANNFGSACVQYGAPGGSEDCLFVNIYAPKVNTSRTQTEKTKVSAASNDNLPVMVYVYGGSLTDGDSALYNFTKFAAEQNVIIVSFNYRLNIFGYLAVDELTAFDPRNTSGNYGLLDQQELLRWVQRNIANFGGDISRVTVFGQSSGGTSIFALMSSPASQGLFQRAIALSGSPNMTMDYHTASIQNTPIVQATGCTQPSLQERFTCLMGKSAADLVKAIPPSWAQPSLFDIPRKKAGNGIVGLAIIDGVTVPKPLFQALQEGMVKADFMITNMVQEPDLQPSQIVFNQSITEFETELNQTYNSWNPSLGAEIARQYAPELKINPQKAFDSFSADVGTTCGLNDLASAAHVGLKNNVYRGMHLHEPSAPLFTGNLNYLSRYSMHCLDIFAAFDMWDIFLHTPSAQDIAFGTTLRNIWAGFAATGEVPKEYKWDTFASTPPGTYAMGLIGPGGSVTTQWGYKEATCRFLKNAGFGQAFWWAN